MASARFNRHRPALCAVCSDPLSVHERKACEWDHELVCVWHAYLRYREEFEQTAVFEEAFWISEGNTDTFAESEHRIVAMDPGEIFGSATPRN